MRERIVDSLISIFLYNFNSLSSSVDEMMSVWLLRLTTLEFLFSHGWNEIKCWNMIIKTALSLLSLIMILCAKSYNRKDPILESKRTSELGAREKKFLLKSARSDFREKKNNKTRLGQHKKNTKIPKHCRKINKYIEIRYKNWKSFSLSIFI